MVDNLPLFESIARRAYRFTEAGEADESNLHPFDQRNITDVLPHVVRRLFDNAHYAQATFEAFKFLDKELCRHSGISESGFKLAMQALGGTSPPVKLTPMTSTSEQDEQKGYQFIFAGGTMAIRNPRGHEYAIEDDIETCLDHLSMASMLLRKLSDAGYKPPT